MSEIKKDSVLSLANESALANETISPEVAFVLSRLDGNTDIKTISFMAGLDESRVIELLTPLVKSGVLTVLEQSEEESAEIGSILDLLDHEDADPRYSKISRELRREILLLFSRLGELDHYELLGAKAKAKTENVKKLYFELAKKFHPDRFFGRDIGHYMAKVEKIFERLNLAFAILSNEGERKRYDDALAGAKKGDDSLKEENIKKTGGFEKMNRARRYYEWGEDDYHKSNYISAASNFLLALNLEPENKEYKKAYLRVKPYVDRKKAKELIEKADALVEEEQYGEAWQVILQATELTPKNGELLVKAARIGVLVGETKAGKEFNKKAHSLIGDHIDIYITEAIVAEKKKQFDKARALLKKASVIEPSNEMVKKMLSVLENK